MIKSELTKGGPCLIVDAGDFGAHRDFDPWAKTEFVYDMMAVMEYDVVTPGENELLQGLEAARGLFAKYPDIHVVSANIRDKSGNLIWPESVVIEKDGTKFGVTGVTSASFYDFNVGRGKQAKDEFTMDDSEEALQRVLPQLREQADVVVVLMHEGPGDSKRLADALPGMDVVVVGHNPGYVFNPDRVGQTLLLRPGNRGQYLTVLELTLGADGQVVDYNGEGKPLGDQVAKDKEMNNVVTEWESDWTTRKKTNQREAAAEKAMLQGTEKYVGGEMCARCHMDIYTRWAETPHAHAFDTLVQDEKHKSADCIRCHVTGFGKPSGYEFTVLQDPKGKETEVKDMPALRNVQCESCHGMGTFHGTVAMSARPEPQVCLNCHTGEFAKGFDYASALATGKIH